MKKIYILIFILLIAVTSIPAQEQELRGAWVAWAGVNVPTTEEIVTIMDELAAANFNIVYVDVWRYGYPYFRSEVFHKYTRLYTDPNLGDDHQQPERDVLAEMIAEAHRAGLQVEAWFEAGFNGAATTSSPLYQRKPEWFARKKDGSTAYYGQAGPSMIHCHPEVQQFLIDLAQEIVKKYDVDGIQLDRIRYPSRDCGYDTLTVNLYKEEHNGSEPPSNIHDQEWVQWRADKLTDFIGRFYDSLKTVNQEIVISNATIPWDPMQFCQDWSEWANNGYLDVLIPMLYYNTDSTFTNQLENNEELTQVNDFEMIHPGVTTDANGNFTDPSQLEEMILTTRQKGLHGNVHWYHANLIWHQNDYLSHLKETVYEHPAGIPYRRPNWRQPAIIIDDTSENVIKTDGWKKYNGSIPLYHKQCLYSSTDGSDSIAYYVDIPEDGWYELYTFINTQVNAAKKAKYSVNTSQGENNYFVNQTVFGNAGRWEKLGDIHLQEGKDKHLLTLSAVNDDEGDYIFADAVMLLNTNRPEKYITTSIENSQVDNKINLPAKFKLNQNYPNPFNSSTMISFNIKKTGLYELAIYDILGKKVKTLINDELNEGQYQVEANMSGFSSGIYLYRLSSANENITRRMLFVK